MNKKLNVQPLIGVGDCLTKNSFAGKRSQNTYNIGKSNNSIFTACRLAKTELVIEWQYE